jgi:hypothetical protein
MAPPLTSSRKSFSYSVIVLLVVQNRFGIIEWAVLSRTLVVLDFWIFLGRFEVVGESLDLLTLSSLTNL